MCRIGLSAVGGGCKWWSPSSLVSRRARFLQLPFWDGWPVGWQRAGFTGNDDQAARRRRSSPWLAGGGSVVLERGRGLMMSELQSRRGGRHGPSVRSLPRGRSSPPSIALFLFSLSLHQHFLTYCIFSRHIGPIMNTKGRFPSLADRRSLHLRLSRRLFRRALL